MNNSYVYLDALEILVFTRHIILGAKSGQHRGQTISEEHMLGIHNMHYHGWLKQWIYV